MIKPDKKTNIDPFSAIFWSIVLIYFAICFINGGIKLTTIIFHFLKDLIL